METAAAVAILAGATGAAIVKLVDNILMWTLNRHAKKEDTEETEKTELEKKVDAIADCVAILSIDRLQNCCKQCIHDQEITLNDRQRIHAMYHKAHEIGVNGDLKDLLTLVDKLPLKDPLIDGNNTPFERGETQV